MALRAAVTKPGRGGDLHQPRVPGPPHRRAVPRPVRQQPRRTRPQPQAGGRARRDRDLHGPRCAHVPGSHRALVAENDRLERRPGPRAPGPGLHAVTAPGRRVVPEQGLPQLPRPGRHRRPARPRPDGGRHAPDPRPAHRPGQQRHPGRWRHAGVRQTDQPARDDRPGRVSGEPTAGGAPPARPADARTDEKEYP